MTTGKIQSQANPLAIQPIRPNNAWDRAIADELGGQLFQRLLKFKKGEWFIGEILVGDSDTFMVNFAEWWVGWVRWEEGKPVEHLIGRAPSFIPPPRESLGHGDWQRAVYLGMKGMGDGDILAFASCSEGGRRAVAELARKYKALLHRYPGQAPVVLLESGTYTNQYGPQHKPIFQVAGWAFWDDREPTRLVAEPDRLPSHDDELPPLSAYDNVG
jgi:hypothetical protein